MAVQWVVGGVEVEDDLFRCTAVGIKKEIDEGPFERRRIVADLVIGRNLLAPSSSRLRVDLPATGAQFLRRAVSLPASTARMGSWRSSS
jgi:hypothetical protein